MTIYAFSIRDPSEVHVAQYFDGLPSLEQLNDMEGNPEFTQQQFDDLVNGKEVEINNENYELYIIQTTVGKYR